jgi:hypothetical protein
MRPNRHHDDDPEESARDRKRNGYWRVVAGREYNVGTIAALACQFARDAQRPWTTGPSRPLVTVGERFCVLRFSIRLIFGTGYNIIPWL